MSHFSKWGGEVGALDGMKKDDWIKIFVPFILGGITGGGMGYMTINMTAYFIAVPIILLVLLYICVKYRSEPETDEKVIEHKKTSCYRCSNRFCNFRGSFFREPTSEG